MIEKKERLVALDVFRGITIASMILVNTPGSWSYVYPPLRHAEWHGFTPTDLVFPFFLFAVGAAMSFSLRKYGDDKSGAVKKILSRTLIIFFIGVFMNAFPFYTLGEEGASFMDLSRFRFMGVLHRIGLAYGAGALLCYFLDKKQLIIASLAILFGYWGILYFFGTGDPFSLEGNAVAKLDILLFGESHLYRGFGIPFDPEGLLSTLPAVVSVIIGFFAGSYVQREKDKKVLIINTFLYGNGAIFLALVWDMVFPINKPIWTSSYVLMCSGLALVIISFLIYFVDIRNKKKWIEPFLVFGTNPLAIYVLSILWVKIYFKIIIGDVNAYAWVYQNVFVQIAGNLNGSLLFALSHVIVLWLIGRWMYKKNIIIKV
ncbi:MAG: DUF5009 domain-containing protein [Cyclobacteriaceae bacterium]|nr:DUF5009 domain-containing protein [Cyclobacteriaceae bacterium]